MAIVMTPIYTQTVGAGGAGGNAGNNNGVSGNNSSLSGPAPFTTVTSAGGGYGGTSTNAGANGGSGAALLTGTYSSSTGLFTVDTAGTASLFVYDDNGDTAAGNLRGIVLVGYVATSVTGIGGAAGLITLG